MNNDIRVIGVQFELLSEYISYFECSTELYLSYRVALSILAGWLSLVVHTDDHWILFTGEYVSSIFHEVK